MKKISVILAVVLCMTAAVCRADSANGYIVKLKSSNKVALFASTSDSIVNDAIIPIAGSFKLYTVQTKELCDELIATGTAEYAEPDQTVTLCDDLGRPDDPDYPASQVNIFKIKAISAWNLGIYGNDVKIGYADSGIYPHSELKAAIAGGHNYITPDESDSSGKTDSEGAENNETDDYSDTYGHGTFGAGIIAAEANSFGGIGVAPRAKLYSLKCFSGKTGKLSDIISAINGGVNTFGCKVINMSFGFESYSSSLASVINDAYSKGTILIAAAGNDNRNSSSYPGAYSNVISVASVNLDEKKDSFSNYGTGVNLAAMGSSIKGCDITGENSYRYWEGTSFAAPCVSAAAALCLNINPNMTQSEFMAILNSTCTPLKDNSYYLGTGLLNIENIMNYMMKGRTEYYSPVSIYSGSAFQVITNFGEEPMSFADIWGTDTGYGLKNATVEPNSSYKSTFAVNSADSMIKHFLWKSIESLMPIYKYSNH